MSRTIDDFKSAALLGTCLAREYAPAIFRLLAVYRSLSASEVAARLELHVQTAQDFLEALAGLGVVAKEEVYEGKRPYFRYSLLAPRLSLEIDLAATFAPPSSRPAKWGAIRERKNSSARFSTGRDNASIHSVAVWTGDRRSGRERKISLTESQGRFLFHLPFPSSDPVAVDAIMEQAGVEAAAEAEVFDLLDWLEEHGVIERCGQ